MPTQTSTSTPTLLTWTAPAIADRKRGPTWYLVAGILCAGAVAYGVISGAWSLSVTAGMLAGLTLITKDLRPHSRKVAIDPRGIAIDEAFLPWNELHEFWILMGSGRSELHISRATHWKPDLVLHLGEVDPYSVRDTLGQFLPQNPRAKEKLLDTIIRFCKL